MTIKALLQKSFQTVAIITLFVFPITNTPIICGEYGGLWSTVVVTTTVPSGLNDQLTCNIDFLLSPPRVVGCQNRSQNHYLCCTWVIFPGELNERTHGSYLWNHLAFLSRTEEDIMITIKSKFHYFKFLPYLFKYFNIYLQKKKTKICVMEDGKIIQNWLFIDKMNLA